MKISDLENQQVVKYRLGKHTNGISPDWQQWKQGPMYVQRHPITNKVLIVTPQDECCAEFSPEDFCSDWKQFSCEEYLMEIEGVTQK